MPLPMFEIVYEPFNRDGTCHLRIANGSTVTLCGQAMVEDWWAGSERLPSESAALTEKLCASCRVGVQEHTTQLIEARRRPMLTEPENTDG